MLPARLAARPAGPRAHAQPRQPIAPEGLIPISASAAGSGPVHNTSPGAMGETTGPGAHPVLPRVHGEGQGAHTTPWPTPTSSPSPFVTEQGKHRAGLRDKPALLRHAEAGERCKPGERARTHAATAFPAGTPEHSTPPAPSWAPCPGQHRQSAQLSPALPREGTGLGVTEDSEGHPPLQTSTPRQSWSVPNSPRADPTWAGAAALLGSPGRAAPCPGVPARPAVTQDGVRASPAQPWQGSAHAGRRVPWGQAGRRGQDGILLTPHPSPAPNPVRAENQSRGLMGAPQNAHLWLAWQHPRVPWPWSTSLVHGGICLAGVGGQVTAGNVTLHPWLGSCSPVKELIGATGRERGSAPLGVGQALPHGAPSPISPPGSGTSRNPRPAPAPGAGKGRWFGAERCPGQTIEHLLVISAN